MSAALRKRPFHPACAADHLPCAHSGHGPNWQHFRLRRVGGGV